MTESKPCPKCGNTVPSGAPSGICPKCLLQAGLESDPAGVRGNRFGQLVYDRGIMGITSGIASGFLLSALLGLAPTIIGTTFASRVVSQEKRGRAIMLYVELMFVLTVLVFGAVFQLFLVFAGGQAFTGMNFEHTYSWKSWVPGLFVGCVALYSVYKRWDWRLRLILFMVAVAARNAFA
jgi:hypothetical protein